MYRVKHGDRTQIVDAESPDAAAEQAFDGVPTHRLLVRESRPKELLKAAAYGRVDDIGHALRTARDVLDLSRYELGKRVGLPTQEYERGNGATQRSCRTWERWERGESEPGREAIQHLQAIADAIREARGDQGAIDWDRVRSGVRDRLGGELPAESG